MSDTNNNDTANLMRQGEAEFIKATKHLSIRERALLAPASSSPWRNTPQYEGELFGLYSSFSNGDAFRFANPNAAGPEKAGLEKFEAKYAHMKGLRKKYDDGASSKFARFKEANAATPTRWNGCRDFNRDEKFLCNGEPFPDEKHRRRFGSVPPLGSLSVSNLHTRCLTTNILHTNTNPAEFGALRLFNTPTHSSLRKMQSRVVEERDRLRKRRLGVI